MLDFNFKSLLCKNPNLMQPPNLYELGIERNNLISILAEINKNRSLVLITGTSQMGKTTVMYSLLNTLIDTKKITIVDPHNIHTLDKPYTLYNKPYNEEECFLKKFIAHIESEQPEIIAIDEIKNDLTAKIALIAKQYNIPVIATLHSPSSTKTPQILEYILSKSEARELKQHITMIVSQKLLDRLCPSCKIPKKPNREELAFMGVPLKSKKKPTLYRAKETGCSLCNYEGYKGKQVLQEIVKINEKTSDILKECKTQEAIQLEINRNIKQKMRQDGILKVKQGITNLDDLVMSSLIEMNSNN